MVASWEIKIDFYKILIKVKDFHLARLRDQTSLQGSWWPPGQKWKCSDQYLVNEAASSIMAQSWPWGNQVAVKKKHGCYKWERAVYFLLYKFRKAYCSNWVLNLPFLQIITYPSIDMTLPDLNMKVLPLS